MLFLMQLLMESEAVHKLMGLLLALGNYMNTGNLFYSAA